MFWLQIYVNIWTAVAMILVLGELIGFKIISISTIPMSMAQNQNGLLEELFFFTNQFFHFNVSIEY